MVGLIVRLTLMFWFKSKLPLESVTTPLEEMLPASVKGPVPTNTVVPPVVRLMSRASSAPRPWLLCSIYSQLGTGGHGSTEVVPSRPPPRQVSRPRTSVSAS